MGCMRMSYDDFCALGFDEFAAVYSAYAEHRDAAYKDQWERMRMLAYITIQPHIDHKKTRLTPQKLLSFAWDKIRRSKKEEGPKLTPEEQRERMRKLVEKLGDQTI